MTRAQEIAQWLEVLRADAFPRELLDKAEDHYLDSLGAIIAGRNTGPVNLAERVFSQPGPCRILMTSDRGRAAVDAARINAVAAHALEIDDTEGLDHSGAVVVPVVLALADQNANITHEQKMTAMIAGYEVGRRVQSALGGYAKHNADGWHSTATCGVFAAAASASLLMGLDSNRIAHALSIAASMSGGSWAFSISGSMTKQLHPGFAAGNGVIAAQLAAAGANGPLEIFEDVWGGFFQTHGNDHSDPEQLTIGLGADWAFAHSAIKPYAACRSAHSAIDAMAFALDNHHIDRGEIRSIEIVLDPYLMGMIGQTEFNTEAQARMSLPMSLALLLHGYRLMPWDYSGEPISEASHWLSQITVRSSKSREGQEPLLRVSLEHEVVELHRPYAHGSEKDPMSRAEVIEKFRQVTSSEMSINEQGAMIDDVYESSRRVSSSADGEVRSLSK